MDNARGIKVLLTVCIVLSVAAIAVSGYAMMYSTSDQSEASGDHHDETRYTIFLGMGDRTDDQIKPIEDRMKELITDTGNGYTLEHECGGYVVDGIVFEDRVSLKFLVIAAEYGQITHILDSLMDEFGIEAVYMERESVSSGFYTHS